MWRHVAQMAGREDDKVVDTYFCWVLRPFRLTCKGIEAFFLLCFVGGKIRIPHLPLCPERGASHEPVNKNFTFVLP